MVKFLHRNILLKFFYNKLDRIIVVLNDTKENINKYLNDKNINKVKVEVECIYNPIKIDEIKDRKSFYNKNRYIRKKKILYC